MTEHHIIYDTRIYSPWKNTLPMWKQNAPYDRTTLHTWENKTPSMSEQLATKKNTQPMTDQHFMHEETKHLRWQDSLWTNVHVIWEIGWKYLNWFKVMTKRVMKLMTLNTLTNYNVESCSNREFSLGWPEDFPSGWVTVVLIGVGGQGIKDKLSSAEAESLAS